MLSLAVFATKTSVSLLFSSKMLNTASEKNYRYPSQSHIVYWKFQFLMLQYKLLSKLPN